MSIPVETSFKVDVANKNNSTMLQMLLFANDYGWIVKGHNDGKQINNVGQKYLFSDKFKDIQASSQDSLFEQLPYKEWNISELIAELSIGVSVSGSIIIHGGELFSELPSVLYKQGQTLDITSPMDCILVDGVNYAKVNNITQQL